MKRSLLSLAAILFILNACVTPPKQTPHTVKTTAGWIKGAPNADASVTLFKGVPFAAPPVGNLRWKEPQPLTPWADTLKCTAFGPSPMQNKPVPFMMWSQEFIAPAEPLSEDCLSLNIWTPKRETAEKLPVLVWIYGGGFVSGSSACAVYDGEAVAKNGIVYVSVNYRVGIFGFMAHPGLTKESPQNASGNYALLDQVAALRWIQANIEAFGGDPSKVTIAGQSAGSMAVQSLVASPLAKGLFAGAIAQSGGIGTRPMRSLNDAEKNGESLSTDINALRALPADSILALANKFPFGTFSPIVDGYFLPVDPTNIFANAKHNDVPLITGWVTGDANLVMRQPRTPKEFKDFIAQTYPNNKEKIFAAFPASNDDESISSQRKLAMLQFAGLPGAMWAASNRSKSYMYQFTYVPTDKPGFPNYGAFHTAEVPFALHTLALWDRPWIATDREVEKYMSSYWINFVKTGDPNGAGLTEWPVYEKNTGNIIELGSKAELKPGLYKEELDLLN